MSERDYSKYYGLMSLSMKEKSDYIIKDLVNLPETKHKALLIDFGGANGQLLSLIKNELDTYEVNEYIYIVIEQKEVINIVEPGFKTDDIFFMTLDDFNFEYRNSKIRRYIIFSSVLHELFSFNKLLEVSKKYFAPLLHDAKKIYIRDMYFGGSLGERFQECRVKAAGRYTQYYTEYMGCAHIPTHEKLFEFLMKTRYLNHWDQEKKEYYFSVPYEHLFITFAKYGFITQYVESYRNDHIINEIETRMKWDRQFESVTATHIKIIMTKFKDVK